MTAARAASFLIASIVALLTLAAARAPQPHGERLSARTGVALTPPYLGERKPTQEHIQTMFRLGREVGSTAVFIYQWSQDDLVDVARQMIQSSRQAGLTPIVALSPTTLSEKRDKLDVPQAVRRSAGGKLSFAEKVVHETYIRDVIELAKLKPPYLCLATEINMLALANLREYLTVAHVIKTAYPLIKRISPETKVFVSFQWDVLRMMDVKEPKKVKEWSKQIDVFRPELDVVAFTSYPAAVVGSPRKIPADYYDHVLDHVQKNDEVMFMEIGWPSGGRAGGQEQSEELQADFIGQLPRLMANVKPSILDWSLLHDVRLAAFGDDLATTGLLTTSGKPKPGFDAFKAIGGR